MKKTDNQNNQDIFTKPVKKENSAGPFNSIIEETPDGIVYRKLDYFVPAEPPKGVRKWNILV